MKRVALVTGGTRGIGEAICMELATVGVKVAANFVSNCEAAGRMSDRCNVPIFQWDVSDAEACIEGIRLVEASLGEIDILVNNAGITSDAKIENMDVVNFNRVIAVNLQGCFNMSKALFPRMATRNFGRIINISSVNAQSGQFGQTNYAAAKAGIIGLTKSLAQEGARHQVTVNCVAPGYVETDMLTALTKEALQKVLSRIPVGRLGRPEEIARAVAFLADDKSSFITGSTLSINGGMHMS